jgi:hypothetical protein
LKESSANLHQKMHSGINEYDVMTLKKGSSVLQDTAFSLFVRERGSYSFVQLGFVARPIQMRQVVELVLKELAPRPKNLWLNNQDLRGNPTRVYALYYSHAKLAVLSDQDVQLLPVGCELEVIFA